jgi:mRNA interferase YafQ
MFDIILSTQFKKDLKLAKKRGYDIALLDTVVSLIAEGKTLPPKYKDHDLSGNYEGYRECHIQPDWLLVYTVYKEELILLLSRTGSHSDLF